jgi:hypothetical protein
VCTSVSQAGPTDPGRHAIRQTTASRLQVLGHAAVLPLNLQIDAEAETNDMRLRERAGRRSKWVIRHVQAANRISV